MKNYINRRFGSIPKDEMDVYKIYLHQTLLKEGSTEYAIFAVFNHMMWAYHPLDRDDRLGGLPIPVSFYFGDRDWMWTEAGDNIISKNPKLMQASVSLLKRFMLREPAFLRAEHEAHSDAA